MWRNKLVLDEAEQWLYEHDPYFRDSNKWKIQSMEYPYHTDKQRKYRSNLEIPFSNVFAWHKLIRSRVDEIYIYMPNSEA